MLIGHYYTVWCSRSTIFAIWKNQALTHNLALVLINLPLALFGGVLAVFAFGGLLSSTALNLLVLPTLALRYGRFTAAPNS